MEVKTCASWAHSLPGNKAQELQPTQASHRLQIAVEPEGTACPGPKTTSQPSSLSTLPKILDLGPTWSQLCLLLYGAGSTWSWIGWAMGQYKCSCDNKL